MRKLSLFSGIGGIDLAAHWAGMETVAFCEREPYPVKVLQKNFPGIPIYDDVKTLTKARLIEDGIIGNGRTIDIISAGYPCQPFSNAGKREGKNDDRHLWPEVKRLLEEIRPRWFIGENVAGHVTLGLDDVLSDLGSIGYTAQPVVIPAVAVGAPHRRDRVFIPANSECEGWERILCSNIQTSAKACSNWETDALDAHSHSIPRLEERLGEPSIFRGDDGVPIGMDRSLIVPRLQALGNAVSPYQIYPIMAAIKEIDDVLGR
ncbi:DNA cytosine methyltransferase [Paenibacillus typhae]|uniref:DNA cytosine methyltransferase n=1 Tax=Paenibacillus typhae TaxID=1174501 RepID=UPI001C8D383F|nr:DNA cytosine methyltransferase [Paenibacillus typhae]MBY0011479.1 DNA cytosine methyltransferase [Paenibacillus typhae]